MTNAAEWSGRVGAAWAEEWRLTDMSFADLARSLDAAIRAAAPDAGRALDIGCGAGATSIALARACPALRVTGVDLSAPLVAAATARAAGLPNLGFRVADIVDVAPGETAGGHFDLAFSRHGVMFFDDPFAAFGHIRAMLRPGAALVFSCFADMARNPWAGELARLAGAAPPGDGVSWQPGPFAFADADFVRTILAAAGFADAAPRLVDYRYRVGEGPDALEQAVHFFHRIGPAARALAAVPDEEQAEIGVRLRRFLAERLGDDGVVFPAAAWIWTARAE